MRTPPRIGMVLEGYCNGYFGRDSYHDKRVEGFGEDWIVVRPVDPTSGSGAPELAVFKSYEEMCRLLAEWTAGE